MWPYSEALAPIQVISEGLYRLLPGCLPAQHHLKGPPSSPAVKGLQLCLPDPVPNSSTHEAPGRTSNLSFAPTQGLPANSWLLVLSPQRVDTDKTILLEKLHPIRSLCPENTVVRCHYILGGSPACESAVASSVQNSAHPNLVSVDSPFLHEI